MYISNNFKFLAILFLIASAFSPSISTFEVDESSVYSDYYDRTHRHTFSYQDLHYILYIDEDYQLVYSVFNNETLIHQEKIVDPLRSYADFGLIIEGEYVYLVYSIPENIKYIVHFMRGKIERGSIVWETPVLLGEGDRPFIDLHLGKPVIVYSVRREKSFKWRISLDEVGKAWGEAKILLTWKTGDQDYFPAVHSLRENGLMFIYWNGDTDRIYSVRYLDGNYSNPVSLYNCFRYPMEYQFFYYCWDVAVIEYEKVFFLNPAGQVHIWSVENSSWEIDRIGVLARKEFAMGLSVDDEKSEVYLFSLFKETGDFGYYIRNNTGWSNFVNLTSISDFKTSGNCDKNVINGSAGIRWFEEGEDTIKIKFGLINLREPSNNTIADSIVEEKVDRKIDLILISLILIGSISIILYKKLAKI